MIVHALFGVGSILVLVATVAMVLTAQWWLTQGRQSLGELTGAATMLRRLGAELSEAHPIRRRLESSPVTDLSFEEIAKLMRADPRAASAAQGLIKLDYRLTWIERYSQLCVNLGILGTVTSIVMADPSQAASFRSKLPLALGTTFWGLIGASVLTWIGGSVHTTLSVAHQTVRERLVESFEPPPAPTVAVTSSEPVAPAVAAAEAPAEQP